MCIRDSGGNPSLGDHVLHDLVWQRGVQLRPTEKTVLEAGWKSGRAAKVLRDQASNRQRRAEFQKQIWTALRYPISLLVMLMVAAVLTYRITGPGFAMALAALYAVLATITLVLARKIGRGDASLERMPLVGPLLEDLRELPYLESLHALYGAGVPIVQAHEQAIRSVRMVGLRERLGRTQSMLAAGTPLRDALQQSEALSTETRSLLATGEQAGQLEDALQRALTRRRDVASRKLMTAAKMLGHVTYLLAIVGVVTILYKFYSAYFAAMSGLR